ncbi:MAG: PD-(D/E)XK motif protein [Anaerolineales bacterium]|nr:PD-(D/E)XK motif protein [Anaerolineales bacterium]
MLDLEPLFVSLEKPSGSEDSLAFSAHSVPGYDGFRIAKDFGGRPCILISTSGVHSSMGTAPVALEHLKIAHHLRCRIVQSDGQIEEDVFSVLYCTSDEPLLHTYFLRVGAVIISSLGITPQQGQLVSVVNGLIELFRALTKPAKKSIQGLWAELLLIERSLNPTELVRCWHIFPEERFDFNAGEQRIEVKSAVGRTRQHTFSLEQLIPPDGTAVIIASVLVERAGGGMSIASLIKNISSSLSSAEDVLHLELTVAQTLGDTWYYANDDLFDYELAKKSLEFFDVRSVPSVNRAVPAGVSHVRFQADLTNTEPISRREYRGMGGIFRVAIR